jgi:Putative helicase.
VGSFFEYVQMLPASESHHHAQPGGMIVHALETADIALSLRRKHILPPDAAPEDILRLEHRWTFGVFLAAISHDVGKAMADLRIAYRTVDGAGQWSPLAGSLNQYGAVLYQVDFTPPGAGLQRPSETSGGTDAADRAAIDDGLAGGR